MKRIECWEKIRFVPWDSFLSHRHNSLQSLFREYVNGFQIPSHKQSVASSQEDRDCLRRKGIWIRNESRAPWRSSFQHSSFSLLGFWITLEPGGYSLRNQAKGMLEVLRLAVCSEFDSRVSVRPSKLWTPNREYLLKTHSLYLSLPYLYTI